MGAYKRRYSSFQVHVGVLDKKFEGWMPCICAILGTITKKIAKKVLFEIFCEKLGNYIRSKVTSLADIVCVLMNMKYTIKYFERNHKPKSNSVYYLKGPINSEIQQQWVNNYVGKEAGLRINLDKIYGIVWGQFPHGIKTIICNNKYMKRSRVCLTVSG